MSSSSDYGFKGKLFLAILLALVAGYIWACLEQGRSPLALVKLFSREEAPPAPAPAPAKEPTRPEPAPARKPEPAKTEPVAAAPKPVPAPAPPSRMASAVEMGLLFSDLDEKLKRGELFEARQKTQNTSRLSVPPEFHSKLSEYERRINLYHQLLLETSKMGTITMPRMTQILIKDGGSIVVKVLSETADSISFENLIGMRSSLPKSRCEEIRKLDDVYSRLQVDKELQKQAEYKGLTITVDYGKPMVIQERPGRPRATGLQIFDLADLCARNGANNRLVPLFDEALARDPNLLTTVHETKADRMVEVLIYFLSINSPADANRALELLKEKYSDTKAYQNRVAADAVVREAVTVVLKQPGEDLARATPPAPAPAPGMPPAAVPPPAPRPEPVEVERAPPAPGASPTALAMPADTSGRIASLVAQGDQYFNQAMKHLQDSDPDRNPDGAAGETKKALALFTKANQECYFPAQEMYSKGAEVPRPLLDRVRECTLRSRLCRIRSVSSR